MKKILFILSTILFLTACESPDVDVQDTFGYDVTAEYENEIIVGGKTLILAEIISHEIVKPSNYKFSYEQASGEGGLMLNDELLSEGAWYPLSELSFNLIYRNAKEGKQTLKLMFRDNNGDEKEQVVSINSKSKSGFDLQIIKGKEEIYKGERLPLHLKINEQENDVQKPLSYKAYFTSENISGQIEFNGSHYQIGETFRISSEGEFDLTFEAFEAGETELNFVVEASNGLKEDFSLPLIVNKTDFDVSIRFDESEGYLGDFASFEILLTQEGSEQLTYNAYFQSDDASIQFLGGSRLISNGTWFDLNPASTRGAFKPLKYSDSKIELVVTSSNGVTKTIEADFNIKKTDFEVIIDPQPLRQFYEFDIEFYIKIIPPEVNNYNPKYTMKYYTTTGKNTYLELRNINDSYNSAQGIYEIGNVTYIRAFLSTLGLKEPASGEITFIFTDQFGVKVEKTVSVRFYDWDEVHN